MSDKTIVLSFSYEWKLSYSMLENCKIFSEVGDHRVESERFGHFKGHNEFFLLLNVYLYSDYSTNVKIILNMSNKNGEEFVIKNYKLTMYTSKNKTGLSIGTRESCKCFQDNSKTKFYIYFFTVSYTKNFYKDESSFNSEAKKKFLSLNNLKSEVTFLCEVCSSFKLGFIH